MDFSEISRNPGCPRIPDIIAVKEDRQEHADRKGSGGLSPCDVLSVYLQGGPRYRLDQHTYKITPPIVILIPRGTIDCDLQAGRIDGIFVLFHGHGLLRKMRDKPGHAIMSLGTQHVIVPFWKSLRPVDTQRIVTPLREIAALHAAGFTGQLRRISLLFEALAEYCEAGTPREKTGVHREAWRLRDMLDTQPYDNQNLDVLYDALEFSAAHAEKLFRNAFRVTPVTYRLQLRLRKARELLVSSQLNVSQVARTVGFTDPLYFSRLFHKHYGKTPSDLIRDFSNRRKLS